MKQYKKLYGLVSRCVLIILAVYYLLRLIWPDFISAEWIFLMWAGMYVIHGLISFVMVYKHGRLKEAYKQRFPIVASIVSLYFSIVMFVSSGFVWQVGFCLLLALMIPIVCMLDKIDKEQR